MQLIRATLLLVLVLSVTMVSAQDAQTEKKKKNSDSKWLKKTALKNTEVNILASYFTQDGNNSVVTGGRGTEDLQNTAPTIVVNIPVDSTRKWSFNFGIHIVTSASTDNIDLNVSSDSRKDSRKHLNVSYTKKLARPRLTY